MAWYCYASFSQPLQVLSVTCGQEGSIITTQEQQTGLLNSYYLRHLFSIAILSLWSTYRYHKIVYTSITRGTGYLIGTYMLDHRTSVINIDSKVDIVLCSTNQIYLMYEVLKSFICISNYNTHRRLLLYKQFK